MRIFIFFLFILTQSIVLAQTKPLDTSYYDNRSIKSILFEHDIDLTGYQVEVFYNKSNDSKKLGNRIADTIYEHQPKWDITSDIKSLNKNLIRISRYYLPDSSCIEKHIFISNNNPLIFSFSSITTYFKKEKIAITYHYKNNQPIALYIGEGDFLNSKKLKNIVSIISEKDMKLKYQVFLITNNRKVRIESFDASNYLSRIIFLDNKEFWKGSYIEFYNSLNPREFGYNLNKSRIGNWYEWYDNGKPKAIGKYNGTKFDEIENVINLKSDIWTYYDESGNIIKKEKWENGEIRSSN